MPDINLLILLWIKKVKGEGIFPRSIQLSIQSIHLKYTKKILKRKKWHSRLLLSYLFELRWHLIELIFLLQFFFSLCPCKCVQFLPLFFFFMVCKDHHILIQSFPASHKGRKKQMGNETVQPVCVCSFPQSEVCVFVNICE